MFSNRKSESMQNREESPLSEVKKQVRGLKKSNIKNNYKKGLWAGGERTSVNLMVFCCIATALALRIQLPVRDPRASIDNSSLGLSGRTCSQL